MTSQEPTFDGSGDSLDSAIMDALAKAEPPGTADMSYGIEVVSFGASKNGFTGYAQTWVKAKRARKPDASDEPRPTE